MKIYKILLFFSLFKRKPCANLIIKSKKVCIINNYFIEIFFHNFKNYKVQGDIFELLFQCANEKWKNKERNLSLHMGEVGGNIITVNSALKLRRKHRVTSEIKFLDN